MDTDPGISKGSDMAFSRMSDSDPGITHPYPQICSASSYMTHALKQMQYRFAVIYETPCNNVVQEKHRSVRPKYT